MFEKLVSFTKKVADLADKPSLDPATLKAQFDAAPDEVRVYFNNLIDALKLTTAGDSGAKNIGATTISGLTGNDVQTLLEGVKTYIDNYKKTPAYSWSGAILPNASVTINHNLGYFPSITTQGTIGNIILTFQFPNNNTVIVNNYSGGSNTWNGTVYLR